MNRSRRADRPAAVVAGALPAILALSPSGARSGESVHTETMPTVDEMIAAAAASKRLERALDGTGVDVAIIARVGADLTRFGVSWTHAGIAWRDDPAGRWQVVHALNDRAGRYSRLYRQGLMTFFLDDPLCYDALVLVPDENLRRGLVERLTTGTAASLHQPRYSAIAYPFATNYQNSNQFVLENLALAHVGRRDGDREAAIEHLQRTHFHPHTVRFSNVERLGGSFKANVRFDDHPRASAETNRYAVVTVEAIERWLSAAGALTSRIEIR
jgi:hypothetical protein